jgi:hypothetical protein
MDTSNPTEKQHFVPRFYLRNFSDSNGLIRVLDVPNKRIGKPRPYQSVGYSKFFYAAKTGVSDKISQDVEEWLKVFENYIARGLPKIINAIDGLQHIEDDDRYFLSVFISMLWLRAPGMRDQLNKMHEDLLKQTMKINVPRGIERYLKETGKKWSPEEIEKIMKVVESGNYDVRFNNIDHLRFMVETLGYNKPGFANMFFGMKWKIYLLRSKEIFITTDSPIVEKWFPPKTAYGDGCSFLERTKYFALTPKILIELTYPCGTKKVKRETLFEGQSEIVKMFNIILMSGCQEFVYSGDDDCLGQLLSGIEKPGLLERAYMEKYEKPWAEYRRRIGR